MAKTSYIVPESLAPLVADLPRLFAKVDGMRGKGLRNTPWNITVGGVEQGATERQQEAAEVDLVRVKQNGGAQGDGTAYATYTYDAYDYADTTCTGTAMTGGPFSVLTGGTSSYSSGSAARIAPVAVNVAPTGSPAELLTLPDGTQMLRNVGETIYTKNCTNNDYAASDLGYA